MILVEHLYSIVPCASIFFFFRIRIPYTSVQFFYCNELTFVGFSKINLIGYFLIQFSGLRDNFLIGLPLNFLRQLDLKRFQEYLYYLNGFRI